MPREVSAYGIAELAGDLIGLLDQAGKDDAVFVGHDWGALIVWDLARLHTQRVRAVVAASVPAVDWPAPPTQLMKMVHQDNFFYILYFQPVGPAENELEANPRATLEKVLWSASGDGSGPSKRVPMEGNGFLTHLPTPPALPWGWLSDTDLRHYADEFARTGFFGPLSYYRNFDTNYELVKNIHLDQLTMPTFFITGSKDLVIQMDPAGVDRMANSLPNFYGTAVLDGVGHWAQQERPTEFNEVLLGFLQRLDHTA